MKVSISYFYQIRFFKPHQIPVSTAMWDPKWYHNGRERSYYFKDKNGVYNGLRIDWLAPEFEAKCSKTCEDDPVECSFIIGYKNQLSNTDFSQTWNWLELLAKNIQEIEKFNEEPEVVLIVYETPENRCSERGPIIEWFAENGKELKEWSKE